MQEEKLCSAAQAGVLGENAGRSLRVDERWIRIVRPRMWVEAPQHREMWFANIEYLNAPPRPDDGPEANEDARQVIEELFSGQQRT